MGIFIISFVMGKSDKCLTQLSIQTERHGVQFLPMDTRSPFDPKTPCSIFLDVYRRGRQK